MATTVARQTPWFTSHNIVTKVMYASTSLIQDFMLERIDEFYEIVAWLYRVVLPNKLGQFDVCVAFAFTLFRREH